MRVSENPLHPAMLRLEFAAFSATALDAALMTHPNCSLICTVDESDASAAKLLVSRGFTLVRRTVEGGWQGDLTMPLPDFEHGTLAQRPDLTAPWLTAHKQHYFTIHRTNPPAQMDAPSWDAVFTGKDFRPESAFYILDGGRIAAFSSLRPSFEGWEQAWFGTTPENRPDFIALNAGLVAMETTFMAANGIRSALAEWDSTSPDAAWRIGQYPLTHPQLYGTFVRAI